MACFNSFPIKVLNEKQHEQALINEYNFDHPDAFDMDLLLEVLIKLKEGRKVEVPVYNFVTHSRETNTVSKYVNDYCEQYGLTKCLCMFLEDNVWSQCYNI